MIANFTNITKIAFLFNLANVRLYLMKLIYIID